MQPSSTSSPLVARPGVNGRRVFGLRLALMGLVAVFLASSLAAQSGQRTIFGKNKVRYGKFDWKVYHSPHFDVNYYPASEAQLEKVVSLAESAYDRLSLEFDYQIQDPTPLIIYQTHSDFLQNNIIVNFIPEGVAAFATSARFRMVLPIDLPDNELYELILHELTHIFQYHVIFQGALGRSLTLNPPQWLSEGMASYFADDESTSDRMFLRDAVVNDNLPPVSSGQARGFFAYRYGHAVFDFMEERWGKDGIKDFLFEYRNTIGARVGRAIERAFRIDPEDFDVEFRRWLRQRYLPELLQTGEPGDFGRPFRTTRGNSQETSPVSSPSGDLVAAFSTVDADVDIVLFDAENRRQLRNLTKGYNTDFRNFRGQHLTAARGHGGDIAFSPDGNQLAAFVRKEAGFALAIVNVLKGGIDRVIEMDIQQQTAPAWSDDGKTIAFNGNLDGQFDIFLLDLDTLDIRNLTNDEIYDAAPSFAPGGGKIVFTSILEESGDLFEIDLSNPTVRNRLTDDEYHNTDPIYGPKGERIFFTSDRTGAENIYGLDLEANELSQYTNTITGAFMPTMLSQPGSPDRLVYTGFWKGRFDLYQTEIDEPIKVTSLDTIEDPSNVDNFARFEPDIQVTIDETAKEDKKKFRLFLEDAQTFAGVDDNQTLIGQVLLQFTDFYGDRRLTTIFQSIESFSNFNVFYTDLSRRWQWQVHAFDDRTFFIARNFIEGRIERGRTAYKQTGLRGTLIYPFSFYRRAEFSLGYIDREINLQAFARGEDNQPIFGDDGELIPTLEPRADDYPIVSAALIGDTTIFGPAGPAGGHRYRLTASYAPNTGSIEGEGNTLEQVLEVDFRKYFPLTRRSSFAWRLFASARDGDAPNPTFFGGFDTVRGFDFFEIVGDRGFYSNFELRFPLIDFFVTPVLSFQGIQGRFFLDVAGAWFDEFQDFDFYDSENDRLEDALATYGFGITVRFMGLDLHWDVSKRWDLEESGETRTSFWIGQRF